MFLPYIEGATIWIKQGDKDEYIKSHEVGENIVRK